MLTTKIAQAFAMKMIQAHPEVVQNNPRGQELVSLIQSGDETRGAEVANNLCNSYNTTPSNAMNLAGRVFGDLM